MALRAVPEHPKFAELKRLLQESKFYCLGVLEAVWHFTGRFTPRGDIGKYSDSAIEAWVEWQGEPGSLVHALVESGWLDPDVNHRLIVHDWSEHADKATKQALRRLKATFCVPVRGEAPVKPLQTELFDEHIPPRANSEALMCPLPVPVPEPVPVPAAALQPEEPQQQIFPETARVVQELHPGADLAPKLAAAAVELQPEITDSQLAEVLIRTHRGKRQQSAGLWLRTVPSFLRQLPRPPARASPPELCETCKEPGLCECRKRALAELVSPKPPGSEVRSIGEKTRRGGAT